LKKSGRTINNYLKTCYIVYRWPFRRQVLQYPVFYKNCQHPDKFCELRVPFESVPVLCHGIACATAAESEQPFPSACFKNQSFVPDYR